MTGPRASGPHPRRGQDARAPETAPVIIIHSLTHAIAALSAAAEADRRIVLASARDAGIYTGSGWFGAVLRAAREAVPTAQFDALLDCGDDSGAVMAAIRAGIPGVVFTGHADVAARLGDVARQGGAKLVTVRTAPTLDLGTPFSADDETMHRRCAEILASSPVFC